MNIFFLAVKPEECAKMHCDKHVVKMILETAQILCAVHHRLASEMDIHDRKTDIHDLKTDIHDRKTDIHDPKTDIPYRKTHVNHPCVVWASESLDNYLWLIDLGRELAKEYTFRYSQEGKAPKTHKSAAVIEWAALHLPPIESKGLTPPAQAMPDHYKSKDDPVKAYRAYYCGDKGHLLTYKKRERPLWSIVV